MPCESELQSALRTKRKKRLRSDHKDVDSLRGAGGSDQLREYVYESCITLDRLPKTTSYNYCPLATAYKMSSRRKTIEGDGGIRIVTDDRAETDDNLASARRSPSTKKAIKAKAI